MLLQFKQNFQFVYAWIIDNSFINFLTTNFKRAALTDVKGG